MSPVTGLFFLVLLLNQRWSSPLRLQASHCSIFRIMCDVPSIAVFCSEFIESFPGTASKFFLKLLATIPVVPIITGINVHFRFHIRCISIHLLLLSSSSSLLERQPSVGQGFLIYEVSRSHNDTPHSVGLLWTSDQLVAETFTWRHAQNSQQTKVHAPGGIRTHNLSRRAAADLRLRPRGHWERLSYYLTR